MKKHIFIVLAIAILLLIGRNYRGVFVEFLSGIWGESRDSLILLENSELKNKVSYLEKIISDQAMQSKITELGLMDTILAHSVFGQTQVFYSDLILDAGYDKGVQNNSLVYGTSLSPVGLISEVYENNSKLKLFSSNGNMVEAILTFDEEINVKDFNINSDQDSASSSMSSSTDITDSLNSTNNIKDLAKNNLMIKLEGDGAYGFTSKIPTDLKVKVGDKVYMKNMPDLSLGEIVNVYDDGNSKEKTIFVKSNFNSNSPEYFYIVK